MGRNQIIIFGVVILALIVGGVYFLKGNEFFEGKEEPQEVQQNDGLSQGTPTPMETSSSSPSADESNSVKEFTVSGSAFKFVPSTLSVNKGDKVKITFKNLGGSHNFTIDELNVATKTLSTGEDEVVEFTADKAGTFEYYCSVGNHRQMGMKGTLTVI